MVLKILNLGQSAKDIVELIIKITKKLKRVNISFKEDVLTEISETTFESLLQINRVHRSIAIMVAHFIVIIKEICNMLQNEYF